MANKSKQGRRAAVLGTDGRRSPEKGRAIDLVQDALDEEMRGAVLLTYGRKQVSSQTGQSKDLQEASSGQQHRTVITVESSLNSGPQTFLDLLCTVLETSVAPV